MHYGARNSAVLFREVGGSDWKAQMQKAEFKTDDATPTLTLLHRAVKVRTDQQS